MKFLSSIVFLLYIMSKVGAMEIQASSEIKSVLLDNQIKINGIYEHYKGMRYKVLMLAWASEKDDLERWVVYEAQYDTLELGQKPIFTRSLDKFLDTVTIDGKQINRFQLIE